jgi:hypothetical protein
MSPDTCSDTIYCRDRLTSGLATYIAALCRYVATQSPCSDTKGFA